MASRDWFDGQYVVYVDTHGVSHDALITKWWAQVTDENGKIKLDEKGHAKYSPPSDAWLAVNGMPGCNLVYVSGDIAKSDPYGSQIERVTSVIHKSKQSAPGNYWKFKDEVI